MSREIKINKNKNGTIEIIKTEIENIGSKNEIEKRYLRLRDMILNYENQINQLTERRDSLREEMLQLQQIIDPIE
jgi:DNA repair ATPase RecN